MNKMESGDVIQQAVSASGAVKTAVTFSGAKIASAAGAGFALAAIVVMAMTFPKDRREFVVCLVCTLVFSVCGGSALIVWLGIQNWSNDQFGLMGMAGIWFGCGLPGWVLVRSTFIFIEANKDKDIAWYIETIKGWFGKK